jgi:hypothetical protein
MITIIFEPPPLGIRAIIMARTAGSRKEATHERIDARAGEAVT